MNENSNSLKTENSFWQYYPAFWVFRNEDPSANQKKEKTKKRIPMNAPAKGPWRAVSSNQAAAKPDTI